MNYLRKQSIRRQVLLATGLVLLPIVIGALWSSNRTRDERRAEVQAEATSIVATSVAYFDQYLRGLDSMASVLVRHPAVVALNREQCDRLFADVLRDRPLILNVVLRAPDGTLKGSGLRAPEGGGQRIATPYVDQVVSSGRPPRRSRKSRSSRRRAPAPAPSSATSPGSAASTRALRRPSTCAR